MKAIYTARALAHINSSLEPDEKVWTSLDVEKAAKRQDGCSARISWLYRKLFGKQPSFEYGCLLHDVLYEHGGGYSAKMAADVLLHDYMAACGHGKKHIFRLWYSIRAKLFFWAVIKGADLHFNWRP